MDIPHMEIREKNGMMVLDGTLKTRNTGSFSNKYRAVK